MKETIRASALVGGGSAAAILAGIVRNKLMALLVGPEGIGLFGVMQSVVNTAGTITGMGFSNSAVRQVAEARAVGDARNLAHTRTALNRASLILGLTGALLVTVFREPLSVLATGAPEHSGAFIVLAISVFSVTVAGSRTAFLNGLQRLADLARTNIFSSVGGMLIAVAAIWFFGVRGIAVAVAGVPVASLAVSALYARKIKTIDGGSAWGDLRAPLKKMITLGFLIMATALLSAGAQFAVRVHIANTLGIGAAGQFQAAWSVSMLYLGFLLGAMASDYYPRLVAVVNDRRAAGSLVNEQTEAALLLAGPVILCMLTLAPQLVSLLYSGDFGATAAILRWQALGDLYKVIAWSLGFILLAQGRGKAVFLSEGAWNVVYLALVWAGMKRWGLEATGIAFFVSYLLFSAMMWMIVSRSHGFHWSRGNVALIAVLSSAAFIVVLTRIYSATASLIAGLALTAAMGAYSLKRITAALSMVSSKKGKEK